MRSYRFALLVLGLVLVACSNIADKPDLTLENVTWVLVSDEDVDGSDVVPPEDGNIYSILFKADGRFVAYIDCNDWFGSYSVGDQGSLNIHVDAMTEAGCVDPSDYYRYYTIFMTIDSYRLEMDELLVSSTLDDAVRILRFKEAAE